MGGKYESIAVGTPYPELNTVLTELVGSVRQILGDNFVGAYLQGSFAVGGFDEHSDCDFVFVTAREPSDEQLPTLRSNHLRIFDMGLEWAKHLEGSYFSREILRDPAKCGCDLWYLDNGHNELVRSSHCNSVVVRWILREKGIVLSGPEPSTLIEPIPTDVLRRAMLASISNSGQRVLANPEAYRNRFYQSFVVLHYCRKLRDLAAGEVGSKRSGAEWAKENLDQSWSGLIDSAWEGRRDPERSVRQPADEADFRLTLEFVKNVMFEANKLAAGLKT